MDYLKVPVFEIILGICIFFNTHICFLLKSSSPGLKRNTKKLWSKECALQAGGQDFLSLMKAYEISTSLSRNLPQNVKYSSIEIRNFKYYKEKSFRVSK